jgi:hypothetical protein
MTKEKNKQTDDAVEILYDRYVKDDPDILAELEKIQADEDLNRGICLLIKEINKLNKNILNLSDLNRH